MQFRKILRETIKLAGIPLSYGIDYPLVPPSVAGFNLTKICNSRCSMCNMWKNSSEDGELALPVIRKVLKELRQLGVQFVSFAAEGEVFTRKDACEIFQAARDSGLDFGINSNGLYLPDEFVKRLNELKPYSIVFGLDTADAANYEEIRGIPNGLSKVLSSIRKLKSAGYNSISIGSIVLHNNLDQLPKLCHLAKAEGIASLRFTAFSPVGFGKSWKRDELAAYAEPAYLERLRKTIDTLLRFKDEYGIITNSDIYLRAMPEYYESLFNYFPVRCMVGFYNVQIMANGDVPLCSYRGPSAVLGNIKNDSLLDIWYSERAKKERIKIRNKTCPTCWLSCFAENNMRFSIDTALKTNFAAFKRSSALDL